MGSTGKSGKGMLNKSSSVVVLSSHPLTEEISKGNGGGTRISPEYR